MSENTKTDVERDRTPEEASSPTESSDSSDPKTSDTTNSTEVCGNNSLIVDEEETDEMKRTAAKKLIERYFYQLIDGCGNVKCNNKFCASSGDVGALTPNQAAARAIQLFSQDAKLCDTHPSKQAKMHSLGNNDTNSSPNLSTATPTTTSNGDFVATNELTDKPSSSASSSNLVTMASTELQNTKNMLTHNHHLHTSDTTKAKPAAGTPSVPHLTEDILMDVILVCAHEKSFSRLIRMLGSVFSSRESLARSFQKQPVTKIDEMLERAPGDLKNLKKEDLRTMEGDLDKDEDSLACKEEVVEPHFTTVDLASLRRTMKRLYDVNSQVFEPLNNALQALGTSLSVDIRMLTQREDLEEIITVFVIVFEVIHLGSTEFLDVGLPAICAACAYLPVWAQGRLAQIWAEHCKPHLRSLLETLQQLVTLQVITGDYNREADLQDNEIIVNATKVMKILFYANLLAGEIESSKYRETETFDGALFSLLPDDEPAYDFVSYKPKHTPPPEDPLAQELAINLLDCRRPFLPFEEFYNEPLSDIIEMDQDYLNYKSLTSERATTKKFSFMLYSFILTPATKSFALYFDSRIKMFTERHQNIFNNSIAGQPPNPYLKLKVKRDSLIDNALLELEMVAMSNPKDLKKQLVVEFDGEQGIDEGGVSKEFFQLIVEEIFNPDYGMFVHNDETQCVWFNPSSFENEAQFTLIGIVLGLAIYNNVILAINFPMVVYRKLMGMKGSFADLEDWSPVLYKSLKSILDYDGHDIETVFMQTFKICYQDVFGNTLFHELRPDGDNVFVNQDNKQEFVDAYADYLLNESVEKQFKAFKKGFQIVTDESPLKLLFRPADIELLVCGSKQFNFNELEQSTEYDGGYTSESQIIKDFWCIVHALTLDSKKKLLQFTTGSDRVPVGGLSRLKLIIARNGPDSDRLPTSHTCFNVLLLPEYTTKEKLEDRLLKAINYSKGFGML